MSEHREANADDIARMAALLARRGALDEDSTSSDRKRHRAIQCVIRYSDAAFGDVLPAMSAAYAVLHHMSPLEMHPYSRGAWQLAQLVDATWAIGYKQGVADAKEDAAMLDKRQQDG